MKCGGMHALVALQSAEPKLFVGGLPADTEEAEIYKVFAKYGAIDEVIMLSKGGRSGQKCCFVKYMTAPEAVRNLRNLP